MAIEVLVNTEGEPVKTFNIEKNSFVIGRSEEADITLADVEGLSRKHLQVDIEGDQIFITDLNSSNGVFINDEKIAAGEKVSYMSFLPMTVCGFTAITINIV